MSKELLQMMLKKIVEPEFDALEQASTPRSSVLPEIVMNKRVERAHLRLADALASLGSRNVPVDFVPRIKDIIRRWAELDFEDGFPDVVEFEIECAQERERIDAEKSGNPNRLLDALEKSHRRAVIKAHGSIELKGLRMSARIYQDIDQVYVPLFIADPKAVSVEKGAEINKIRKQLATEVVKLRKRVVIVGAPGSGKSVLISYLASSAAAGHFDDTWDPHPVPFVIPIRSLEESQKVNESTIADISGCDSNFLLKMLEKGRAMLLFDGLDEIGGANNTGRDRLQALLDDIATLEKRFPKIRIVITTRPRSTLKSAHQFGHFVVTNLLPMEREEVYVFIDRWCLAAEKSVQKDMSSAVETAKRIAADLKRRVESSRAIEKLAETPLMASVVCIVHRFLGGNVPERRAALYEACTNVLLYEWDRSKFPEGSFIGTLGAAEKRVLLAGVARSMHDRGLAELGRPVVENHIADRLTRLTSVAHENPQDEARRIVDEIKDRSGLLVERRPGYFAFSHHTFQEYLTAIDYVREKKYDDLIASYKNEWWHEVIALAAGLPGTDASRIVGGLLRADKDDPHQSLTGTMLAAQCVETAIELDPRLQRRTEQQISKLIPPRSLEEAERCAAFGNIAGPLLLRKLKQATPDEQAWIMVALMRLRYEPAVRVLVRMLIDGAPPMEQAFYVKGYPLPTGTPVSVFASYALLEMSFSSKLCREQLQMVIPDASRSVVEFLQVMTDLTLFDQPPAHIGDLNALASDRLRQL